MKFGTTEVKGKKFEVNVNEEGKFWANLDGDSVEAKSLVELREKLADRMKVHRFKTDIKFVRWGRNRGFDSWKVGEVKLYHGTVTGLHAANGNVLISWDDGEKTQEWRGEFLSFPTKKLEEDYIELKENQQKIDKQIEAMEEKYKFDAKVEVKRLMAKEEKTA